MSSAPWIILVLLLSFPYHPATWRALHYTDFDRMSHIDPQCFPILLQTNLNFNVNTYYKGCHTKCWTPLTPPSIFSLKFHNLRQEYGYFSVKQSLYRLACHENTKLSDWDLFWIITWFKMNVVFMSGNKQIHQELQGCWVRPDQSNTWKFSATLCGFII